MDTVVYVLLGILILALLLLAVLLYHGLLYPVDVRAGSPPLPASSIAYKFCQGPYSDDGGLYREVAELAPDNRTIGIYYDDPALIAPEKLRYAVGAILTKAEDDQGIQQAMTERGFHLFQLPDISQAVTAKFPYRTQLSVMLAVWRVYPRLGNYMETKKLSAHPMVQICDREWMHFMAPLEKQSQFYVPEAEKASTADTD